VELPLGKWGTAHISGYLVWAALLYAGVGTWLTVKIGRLLVPLNYARQRFEGDFRFSLGRLRENAESVAVYGGESVELDIFNQRFGSVFENFLQVMKRQKRLNWFTSGYAQVAVIFPVAVVSPRYFAKQIGLGGLMQVVNAFAFVHNSLSFIINAYTDIAACQAVTQRLSRFEKRLLKIRESNRSAQQIVIRREGIGVAVEDLDLDLPDGTPLLRGVAFEMAGRGGTYYRPDWNGQEHVAKGNGRDLAFRPRRDQARRKTNSLRAATALSATWHFGQRAALSAGNAIACGC
jgi:putative ATP-binding cassette transporter